jgi:hypothetical protein
LAIAVIDKVSIIVIMGELGRIVEGRELGN